MASDPGPSEGLPGLIGPNDPSRALTGHHDAAIFLAFATWDLQLVERLRALHHHADRIIVWYFETWPSNYGEGREALSGRFDGLGPRPGAILWWAMSSDHDSWEARRTEPATKTMSWMAEEPSLGHHQSLVR